jgi:hypothetical protein
MILRPAFFVLFLVIFVVGVCTVLSGCGGSMATPPPPAPPNISTILPSSLPAGSGQFNLLLSGQGLSSATIVHFGSDVLNPSGPPVPCPSGNCTTIAVPIPGADVAAAGPVNVTVSNGTLSSNSVVFTVTPKLQPQNTPQIAAFLPTVAPAGGAGFTMIVIGVNVAVGATVNFGAQQLTPTSVLNCIPGEICPQLVQVPASAIASAGQVAVTLTNPGASGGTSSPVNFLVLSKSSFPIEESVNNASPAAPGNGGSTHSSISAGGAFVAFDSTATNFVAGATGGHSEVYLRSNCFAGVPGCVAQTTLISAGAGGNPGSGGMHGSDKSAISLDGRFVAFESDDTNLVPGATQVVEQIYLRDTCNTILGTVAGCTPSTTLVSASASGAPGNAPSLNPTVSAFGFFVAFQSTATNLVSAAVPAGVSEIYLSRGCPTIPVIGQIPGCTPSVALASFDASGNPGDKDSVNASIDAVGLALTFQSLADNIVAATPGNGFQQIYGRNTCFLLSFPGITIPCTNVVQAISADAGGNLGTGDSVTPATGFIGSVVAYATHAPNLLPTNISNQQIIAAAPCVIENTLGIGCSPAAPVIVSLDQNGVPGQADSSNPAIDGEKVAFTSLATLLPNISGQQVYVGDSCLLTNCTRTVALVSADSNGKPIGGDFGAIEGAGSFATFATTGSIPSLGTSQVFLDGLFF